MVLIKIFISSEMKDAKDTDRRQAAIEEIRKLGHDPVCFEQLPSRPLPANQDPEKKCIELVRKSDILMAIVDDTVTKVMEAEIDEAYKRLGSDAVILYFTKNQKRDAKAKTLWDSSKKSNILKEFDSTGELRHEIARSIASYLDDAFSKQSSKSEILLSETVILDTGARKAWRYELSKGEILVITCISTLPFLAGFYPRESYIRKRNEGLFGGFSFGNKAEKKSYTEKVKITQNDDYWFVVQAGGFLPAHHSIAVEVKKVQK